MAAINVDAKRVMSWLLTAFRATPRSYVTLLVLARRSAIEAAVSAPLVCGVHGVTWTLTNAQCQFRCTDVSMAVKTPSVLSNANALLGTPECLIGKLAW